MLPRFLDRRIGSFDDLLGPCGGDAETHKQTEAESPGFISALPPAVAIAFGKLLPGVVDLSLRSVDAFRCLESVDKAEMLFLLADCSGAVSDSTAVASVFSKIDLAGCGLDDGCLANLQRFLGLNRRWDVLDCSMHHLSNVSLASLLDAIPPSTTLRHLSFAGPSSPSCPSPSLELLSAAIDAVNRAPTLERVILCSTTTATALGPEQHALLESINLVLRDRDPRPSDATRCYTTLPAAEIRRSTGSQAFRACIQAHAMRQARASGEGLAAHAINLATTSAKQAAEKATRLTQAVVTTGVILTQGQRRYPSETSWKLAHEERGPRAAPTRCASASQLAGDGRGTAWQLWGGARSYSPTKRPRVPTWLPNAQLCPSSKVLAC